MAKKEASSCLSCGLLEYAKSPKMDAYGAGKKGIMVIGEAPGVVEDRKGMPWQGKTGRLLQDTMHKLGIDLFEDCRCINAVNCRPPDNRTPTPFEIRCCWSVKVRQAIEEFKPKVLILLGATAIQSFLSPRWPTDLGGISKWRGWMIPDRDYQFWVVPTFHPSYIYRIDSKEANTVWEQDLTRAILLADQPFPKFMQPKIHFIEDLSVLEQFHDVNEIAFDYETTGLKPHWDQQRIVCASVAGNDSHVYVFMIPDTRKKLRPFLDLLTDNTVGKMAHNMKFEDTWTQYRLNIEIKNWQWDSMLAAHLLDNRSGITGLKFQTYVNFGVPDYASDVTPYLRTKDKSGNGLNNIYKLLEEEDGPERLMKYCGLDSHYEYMLAKKQMKELDYQYLPFD